MEIASGGELFERLKDSPNKVVDEDIARSVIKVCVNKSLRRDGCVSEWVWLTQ